MTNLQPALSAEERQRVRIEHVRLVVGLEVHVELATRSKMFTRAANPAGPGASNGEPAPNTLVDPVVLALPGALPVPNARAVELAIAVGLTLGCTIAPVTRFDRKSYFYPDLPKAYQISQYDQPLCINGVVDVPAFNDRGEVVLDARPTRIGIERAHLEEDAGKLLHEAPGGGAIDHSIVDLNRAGTPLLEIVTRPDFTSAAQAEAFCRWLRHTVRLLGASRGVLQEGHVRFEPNINCVLTLEGGRTVATPIVEVKNLNSFRAVVGAIEYEHRVQPERWRQDGRVMGPGSKRTFGWDDANQRTTPQREKEDAHDYRYFPDPDLPPLRIDADMLERAKAMSARPWLTRLKSLTGDLALPIADATLILNDPATAGLFERAHALLAGLGHEQAAAARALANALTQKLAALANARGLGPGALAITPENLADLIDLRLQGELSSNGLDELLEALATGQADNGTTARALASERGLLLVRDAAAIDAWCQAAIDAHPAAAQEVRAGKPQALGRLIGHAMQQAQGAGDPKAIRQRLLELLA
ncbi:MAG: Asp-tRNA(Asn)/Glu-tRNA(Gln) amidotransferase subunit GatB [Phycisphaeraceae bacterium]|nr:Asp-tRNA(Asn)/Glu-tRNA(Gln) amidotransferase subunit GatB [Phycisphaeraceae bacterium]